MEKRIEELSERLEQLGQRWNSHLSRIAQGMDELASRLAELLPAGVVDRHEHRGLVWSRWEPHSNIGAHGPCFYRRARTNYGMPAGRLLSMSVGDRFRLEGYAEIQPATPIDYREAAAAVPDFLHSLFTRLQQGGDEAKEAAGVLSATLAMLSATITSLRAPR